MIAINEVQKENKVSRLDYAPEPDAPRRPVGKSRSVRPLDPKWQALHALLKSYLKEHADTQGNVRKELRDALFLEVNDRLDKLTKIIVAKYNSRGITAKSEALSLQVWERNASFTNMMLRYKADDARQGFNWFYTIVLYVSRDMWRSGHRSVDTVYHSEMSSDAIGDEAFEALIEKLGAIDDDSLTTEQKAELSLSYDRLMCLPAEMQRIAEHLFAKTEDLTQEQFARSIGISLPTFKRRKDSIEQYLQGKTSLETLLEKTTS